MKHGDEFWKVPKLDASGKDWPLWKGRLELSLLARGLLGHLTNNGKPVNPADANIPGWSPTTPAELAEMQAYEAAIKKWTEDDVVVRQQIAILLPDSLFIQLLSLSSAKEFFDTLKGQFEKRSLD